MLSHIWRLKFSLNFIAKKRFYFYFIPFYFWENMIFPLTKNLKFLKYFVTQKIHWKYDVFIPFSFHFMRGKMLILALWQLVQKVTIWSTQSGNTVSVSNVEPTIKPRQELLSTHRMCKETPVNRTGEVVGRVEEWFRLDKVYNLVVDEIFNDDDMTLDWTPESWHMIVE